MAYADTFAKDTARYTKIAYFVHVFLFALVAGVFWGTWFSLSRSIESIAPATFLEIGRTMITNLGGPMRILMPAALLSAVPVLVLQFRRRPTWAFALAAIGVLLFVVALLVTLIVNVPIDGQIAQWTVATLPPDWGAVRDRWQAFHTVRTAASLGALGCALASALSALEVRR